MKITYKVKMEPVRDLCRGDCFQSGDSVYRIIDKTPGGYQCYNFRLNNIVIFGDIEINVVLKEVELVVSDVNS